MPLDFLLFLVSPIFISFLNASLEPCIFKSLCLVHRIFDQSLFYNLYLFLLGLYLISSSDLFSSFLIFLRSLACFFSPTVFSTFKFPFSSLISSRCFILFLFYRLRLSFLGLLLLISLRSLVFFFFTNCTYFF